MQLMIEVYSLSLSTALVSHSLVLLGENILRKVNIVQAYLVTGLGIPGVW